MDASPISFRQIIKDYERIRIPRLQRDYAQGRTTAKETEIRTRFLHELAMALEHDGAAPGFTSLNLDFIYGSIETVPFRHFSPMDGQQRLTTLFLLHWLLAWKDDRWQDFTDDFREGTDSRFTYCVRNSSNEFFDALLQNPPPTWDTARTDLKGWITDQSWYFRYWRLDPTITGVLEMLQVMYELFKERPTGLYARLVDPDHPAITLQLLNLGDFPLSDDLYIKMNARGKPLTAFETFKAQYEEKLPDHFATNARREINGTPFPISDFVTRRLDTAWTDFLWGRLKANGSLDPQRLDESFMNIFRMVALASRDPNSADFSVDIAFLRDDINPPSYPTFRDRQWLDPDFSTLLVSLMETWFTGGPFPPEFATILNSAADLSVPHALIFVGYALFVREHEGRVNMDAFQEWMRVVQNLSINSDIDRNERLQNPAKGLRELLPDSNAILARVATLGKYARVSGFTELQQTEEALKANLLLADSEGWRPLIDEAEKHGYFRGQIDFLLDFSGIKAMWEQTGTCAWDAGTHAILQRSFRSYLDKATMMFDKNGLIDLGESRWQRALLSMGDYLLLNGWSNWSFLVNESSRAYSWKRLLRDSGLKRNYLKKLWDQPNFGNPLPERLDSIIAAANNLEPWQEALVKNPGAVLYCERGNIQREGNYVLLLRRERRSAEHAELFTYLLYGRFQPPAPFVLGDYFSRDEPHFPLQFSWGSGEFSLMVYGGNGEYKLWIELPLPASLEAIFQNAGFAPSADPTWLLKTVALGDIEIELRNIATLLRSP